MRRKKVRIQNEQMKAMMSSLMTHKGEGAANSIDQLVHAHELAFVMTDMEGSTAQAAANPAAYAKIQQVHDMVRGFHHRVDTAAAVAANTRDVTSAQLSRSAYWLHGT